MGPRPDGRGNVLGAEVPQREAIATTFGLPMPPELLEVFRLVVLPSDVVDTRSGSLT
jgi:hypothetical protein